MISLVVVDRAQIAEQLGGATTIGARIDNALDPMHAIQQGIRLEAAEYLARRFGLGAAEVAGLLRVSQRTLAARRRRVRLTPAESERLWRAARVLAHGVQVLGNPERVGGWLVTPSRALGGRRPIDLVAWEVGADEVDNVLGRIEHGVF